MPGIYNLPDNTISWPESCVKDSLGSENDYLPPHCPAELQVSVKVSSMR